MMDLLNLAIYALSNNYQLYREWPSHLIRKLPFAKTSEGELPSLQTSSTESHPEPVEFSPQLHLPFLYHTYPN
jgi:hypothetical protein